MSVRDDLADAASTVDGVQVDPYYVQTMQLGTGMVRLDRTDYPDKFGGICVWQVVIILTTDVAAAEKWLEAHQGALVAALRPEMTVRSVTQQQLPLDGGQLVPAVFIEGTREEE